MFYVLRPCVCVLDRCLWSTLLALLLLANSVIQPFCVRPLFRGSRLSGDQLLEPSLGISRHGRGRRTATEQGAAQRCASTASSSARRLQRVRRVANVLQTRVRHNAVQDLFFSSRRNQGGHHRSRSFSRNGTYTFREKGNYRSRGTPPIGVHKADAEVFADGAGTTVRGAGMYLPSPRARARTLHRCARSRAR